MCTGVPVFGTGKHPRERMIADIFIDQGSGAALILSSDLQRLITEYMGLFPEIALSDIHSVLDLACGPGDWVLDVACAYPNMGEVMGIDSQAMIRYAQTRSRVQGLDNAFFKVMDIHEPLAFEDSSFDFVQAHFFASILAFEEWPGLLAQCRRLLRPGGIIRLVEIGWPDTNSPAVQRLGRIVSAAQAQLGHTYNADGHHLTALVPWLRDARFAGVRSRTHEIPLAPPGWVGMHAIMRHLYLTLLLMSSQLLQLEVTTRQELAPLLDRFELDASGYNGQDFQGVLHIVQAWGVKENNRFASV
jgi:ubiquinone/menaquinone biosynthesis C-methylase UbiE